MNQSKNWGVETDAVDYFTHQKKELSLADRRPVIKKASDLVGPGIGTSAVRVDDWSNILATFNGYYSSEPGVPNAPNDSDAFVGFVVMDDTLGGRQVLASLTDGEEYTRIFIRNPSDAASISFGAWRATETTPSSIFSTAPKNTVVGSGPTTMLTTPSLFITFGQPDTYERVDTAIKILRPGVYSGALRIQSSASWTADNLYVEYPDGDTNYIEARSNIDMGVGISVPLHFWTSTYNGYVRIDIVQNTGSNKTVVWDKLAITRIGDAPVV